MPTNYALVRAVASECSWCKPPKIDLTRTSASTAPRDPGAISQKTFRRAPTQYPQDLPASQTQSPAIIVGLCRIATSLWLHFVASPQRVPVYRRFHSDRR
jgi:hypothetical protein